MAHYQVGQNQACEVYAQSAERISTIGCPKTDSSAVVLPFERPKCQAAVSLPEQVPLSVDLQSCLEEADSDQSHLCQSCHSFVGPASHNYPKEQSEGSQPTRPTSMAATTDNVDHEGSCVTMTSKHVATPTAQDSSSRIASARAGADPGPKPRCCESFPDSLAPAIPVPPISPVSVIFSSTLCSPGEAGSGHSERMDSQQSPSWLQAAPHAQQDGCFPFAGCSSVSNSLNDAQSAASAAAAHIPNPVRHSQATPWCLGGGAGDDDDDQDMATPTRLSPRDSHPVTTTTPVLEPTITKGVMLVVPRDVRDEVDDKTMMMMMLDDPVQVGDADGVNVASNVVSYSSSFAKLSSSSASSKHVPLLAMHDEKAKDAADGDGDDDDTRGAGPVSQRPVPPEVKSPSRVPSAMTATNARIPTVSSFKNVKYQSIMMNYSGVKNPPSATYHTDVEKAKTCYPVGPASNRQWGVPVGWGLRGGGETSLTTPSGAGGWGNSTGTGGGGNASWGAPGAGSGLAGGAIGGTGANSVAAPPNQWGAVAANARANTGAPSQGPNGNPNNNPSMNPAVGGNGSNGGGSKVITPNPSTSPGQHKNGAGGGAANANNGPGNAANGNGGGPGNGTGGGVSAASKQLEQLSSIREAIYSPDGWGGNNVNQDTVWETPPSPEPGSKENLPLWKQTSANDGSSLAGTEIWEASLRNGGQPPAAPAQPKAPWGHTPTSHIGGTWGEDDDAGDSSNMWTGIPANNAPPQWGAPPVPGAGPGPVPAPGPTGMGPGVGNAAPGNPMWGATAHKKEEWGAPPGAMGPNTAGWGTGGRMMGNMGHGPEGMGGDMGISGPAGPSHWGGPPNKGPGSQWGAPVPPVKEIKTSGWDEPSPPTQKRPAPSVDDGTALWGNPTQQQNKVSHWKEMPMPNIAGRGGMPGPGGPPPGRFPPGGPAMKPEMPMWPHQSRNGSWGDGSEGMWMEDKSNAGWGEPPQTPSWSAGPKPKTPTTPSNWGESEMDPSSWGQPPKPVHPKPQPKEMIWGSKQFRILTELGYKKEDVETCLRASNMVMEDALEMLNAGRGGLGMEPWRRAQEDHSGGYDMGGHPGGMPYPPHGRGGYNPQQAMPYHGAGTHLLNNAPAGLGGLGGINPGPGYKLLQSQQPPPLPPQSQPPMGFPGGRTNRGDMNVGGGGGQPTQTQLRVLVQQIQMAVQAGHLNPQILNQPLAPQTLLLLNQLLQNIKLLQTLSQQQAVAQAAFGGKAPQGPMANQLMSLMQQANKTKQQITSLQNQINTQQALFVKQSAYVGGQPPGGSPGQTTSDLFKAGGGIEPVNNLKDSFNQLTIDPHAGQSQSRLTQWTMPSMDKKDMDLGVGGLNDFSRAPGTSSAITPGGKPPLNSSLSSPNLNPLLSQGESTWSSLSRSQSESGWPDSTGNDTNDGKEWSSGMSNYSSISDLVPEFEPGKPWKGPQLKTVDDDPTLTPGQFAMSALKDPDLFSAGGSSNATGSGNGSSAVSGAKTSPPPGGNSSSSDSAFTPMSLSSSTWSFNPSATSSNANAGGTSTSGSSGFSSAFNKYGPPKGSWGTDAPPPSGNNAGELWGMGPKRGPPPGLAPTAPGVNNSNVGSQGGKGPSWGSSGAGGVSGGSNGGQRSGSTSSWGASTGGGPGSGGSSAWGQPTTAWLMLRNLTPQIDGSTLKTLCVQHGPLHTFHLYLNQGIALVRYSTNEEAAKAQAALNNCVLSNTTILADLASESDVQQWLQQLGHSSQQQQQQQQSNQTGGSSWSVRGSTPGASSSSGGPAQNKPNTDSWGGSSVGVGGATSPLWPSNSGSVWSTPALDRDSLRATPSSLNATLNSFLPGDLLGGESM